MQVDICCFPQKSTLCDPCICGKTSQIGVDEAIERAVHDGVDFIERQANAVVGDAALWKMRQSLQDGCGCDENAQPH